jgi:Fe2+ transport system protein FeoA
VPIPTSQDARSLSDVPAGTSGMLSSGTLTGNARLRLGQLGLRTGAVVTVLGRTAGGGRLIGVGTSRIGLDRDTSRRLTLRLVGAVA